jgi:radical SAM protein with 4Fe4S-binding SPASM domain
MSRYVPGYCRFVRDRLRVAVDGDVAPCSYSTDRELELGNLADKDLDAIWNGKTLQDLRRAHFTWDYPTICKACRFKDPIPEAVELPFAQEFCEACGADPGALPRLLEPVAPAHMTRHDCAPMIRVSTSVPTALEREYIVLLALGGEPHHVFTCVPEAAEVEPGVLELVIPDGVWRRLRFNLGYWWEVFATDPGRERPVLRSSKIRCLIRHRALQRLDQSGLEYPDEGHLPRVDLGTTSGDPRSYSRLRPELARRRFPRRAADHLAAGWQSGGVEGKSRSSTIAEPRDSASAIAPR